MELRVGERAVAATVKSDREITLGGRTFSVESIGDGLYSVSDGTSRWRVAVAGPPDDRWIAVNGQVANVEVGSGLRRRSRGRSGAHEMSAPMPATVVTIVVQPGSTVKKGDTVLTLEAMKMELPIRAARDGVVKAVHCVQGDLVQPGVNLVELE
jgi:biotin carboxyl carrier protein